MNWRLLLILLLLPIPLAQAEWGRLFYTPTERAVLDRDATSATHRFDGEVRRSNGKRLRWVDGQASGIQPPRKVKPGERWDPINGKVYAMGREAEN